MATEPALTIPNVQTILEIALRKAGIVGIGESIEQPVLNDAFLDANDLLSQWQENRYLVYHLRTIIITSTGAQTYSVGNGQPININPRPDRLESAFIRLLNTAPPSGYPVDIPLDIIPSMEDYNRIAIKNLGTIAWRVFYDPGWPNGTLYPWPIPQANIYQLGLTFKEVLTRFQKLQDQVNLPPQYAPALKWCLAEVLRTSYQMPPDPMISKFARRALNAIRLGSTAVPLLTMPAAVTGRYRAWDYRGSDEV